VSDSRKTVLGELRDRGLLLVTDPVLPSVAGLVAGEPVRGSWWAHSNSHEIFRVLESLDEDEALSVKLIAGKHTLVHRALWPELFAIATSQEDWQTKGLDPKARSLWKKVDAATTVFLGRIAADEGVDRKALAARARELETRLLVYGRQVHTATGAHQKVLASWTQLAKELGVRLGATDPKSARAAFEERTTGRLPWPRLRTSRSG
jgi:hypothetical protein